MTDATSDKKQVYAKIGTESAGFALAEFVSMGVSLGVVGIADQAAPDLVKSASKVVSKVCIEPFLDTIEKGLTSVCRLKECQPDMTKNREERAEQLAKTMIVFSAAWVASIGAKLLTRGVINRMTGVNTHEIAKSGNWFVDQINTIADEWRNPETRKILIADEGIHYGSILLMNTVGASVTDDVIDSTTKVLNKCGISKQKAHEMASMAVVWELPNLLGMVAGIGSIAQNHLKNASFTEKLATLRDAPPALPAPGK